MKILFVRHGKSIANATGMVGTADTPLAEEGLVQARITGQDLKNHNVSAIICSSLIRAQQTAEIIAGELGIPIHSISVIDELRERYMGNLEGHPKKVSTEYYFENDSDNEFEPQSELIERMSIALKKVIAIAKSTPGSTVVVGHATSGFYFLQVAKGFRKYSEFDQFNQMNNAEFVEVEVSNYE